MVTVKLLVLVDSLEYARSNCYIHQLLTTLERNVDATVIPMTDVIFCRKSPKDYDVVLSCLKLRTIARSCFEVEKFMAGMPLYVYDQDPWECFSDQATYPGSYQYIAKRLNVKSFLNTSKWWSDHINSKGLPSKFVTMWMLPEYCSSDPKWSTRKVDVGFCGQLHPYRRELFESLQKAGISVQHFPSGDYAHYLNTLSQMKIFVHSEMVDWSVDGIKLPGPNALWIKDIEATARGCLSIRNYDDDMDTYATWHDVTTKMAYEDVEQLVEVITSNLAADPVYIDEDTVNSVEYIKNARGWRTVLDAMEIK